MRRKSHRQGISLFRLLEAPRYGSLSYCTQDGARHQCPLGISALGGGMDLKIWHTVMDTHVSALRKSRWIWTWGRPTLNVARIWTCIQVPFSCGCEKSHSPIPGLDNGQEQRLYGAAEHPPRRGEKRSQTIFFFSFMESCAFSLSMAQSVTMPFNVEEG